MIRCRLKIGTTAAALLILAATVGCGDSSPAADVVRSGSESSSFVTGNTASSAETDSQDSARQKSSASLEFADGYGGGSDLDRQVAAGGQAGSDPNSGQTGTSTVPGQSTATSQPTSRFGCAVKIFELEAGGSTRLFVSVQTIGTEKVWIRLTSGTSRIVQVLDTRTGYGEMTVPDGFPAPRVVVANSASFGDGSVGCLTGL